MPTEADTCRKFTVPALQRAGWEDAPHAIGEQRAITDGRIVPRGKGHVRRPPKRADYLLFFRRDFIIAVVEAKKEGTYGTSAMQQAKQYAEMLGLKFAYATNGREIIVPESHTVDFARVVSLRARTQAIARHLTDHLKKTDRFAKTIVLCVDQEHAWEIRAALNNLNADLVRDHPDYVCRVTADEGDIGKGHMERFQDVETRTPVILTTSQLLTTGLDAPTCRNVVLVRLVNSMVEFNSELDSNGKQLRVVKLTDYTAEKVRSLCTGPEDLRTRWADLEQRAILIEALNDRGIDFQTLALQAGKPDADPFDLLCHLAFNAPVLTRRQRAERVRREEGKFFARFGPEAREILGELLEKYANDGELQFTLPDVLKVSPIALHGTVAEIVEKFGGADSLRIAIIKLQCLLYAS
jgi:type I site-specific restriction endonuclease